MEALASSNGRTQSQAHLAAPTKVLERPLRRAGGRSGRWAGRGGSRVSATTKVNPSAPVNGHRLRVRLLLADNDAEAVESSAQVLHQMGADVTCAMNGRDALTAARRATFDLLVVEMRLPDMTGAELVKSLRAAGKEIPFVVVCRAPTISAVVEAVKLGAEDVLVKPVDVHTFMPLVHAILRANDADDGPVTSGKAAATTGNGVASSRIASQETYGSLVERWALFVLDTIDTHHDPKTMSEWSRSLGVSRSVLAESCRLVRIPPHDARDFARALRAVCRARSVWEPETLFNCADGRTLKKLLSRAGLPWTVGGPPPTLRDFLQKQTWIRRDSSKLAAVLTLFAERRR
jgi:CheY-like chemotaxis protein